MPTNELVRRQDVMDPIEKRVTEKFNEFDVTHNPELLQDALDMIEAVHQNMPISEGDPRKQVLSHWIRFLAALDQRIDPKWDPEDVPETGITPPPSHGVAYPSGVDPAVISDPAVRAQYERDLDASKAKAERYSVQLALHRLDERAVDLMGRFLAEQYIGSPTDWQEFEELLVAVPMVEARKARLRAFMSKPE
jgi:hypothetical protein